MEPEISQQFLYVEGRRVDALNHNQVAKDICGVREELKQLFHFIAEWYSPSHTLHVQTSGSTGTAKQLEVSKEKMIQSALTTCRYLQLEEQDRALLCMDLRYIGAKMMVVRALLAGLNLITVPTTGHPLATITSPLKLLSMVPLQVYNSLSEPHERQILATSHTVIIGGGSISPTLEKELSTFGNIIYSTYGMTETLSHIALRRLNGKEASQCYYPLPPTTISVDSEQRLQIHAPHICNEILSTNDLAQLYPDGGFTIIGRYDNIINSGGIKLPAEQLERELQRWIETPFVITSTPDSKLGEAVTLLLETPEIEIKKLQTLIQQHIPAYHRPKHILNTPTLPRTNNGKWNRPACKFLAQQLLPHSR